MENERDPCWGKESWEILFSTWKLTGFFSADGKALLSRWKERNFPADGRWNRTFWRPIRSFVTVAKLIRIYLAGRKLTRVLSADRNLTKLFSRDRKLKLSSTCSANGKLIRTFPKVGKLMRIFPPDVKLLGIFRMVVKVNLGPSASLQLQL